MSAGKLIKLGEVTHRITKGTTPKMGGFTRNGISFVKVESITDEGEINVAKLAYIDENTHGLLARSMLQADDLLFSIAGTIGRVARVPSKLLPANTNQALAIIRPDRSKIDPAYLLYCLRDSGRIREALSVVVQSVQANLSLAELSAIEIPYRSLDEQEAIAEVLGTLDDKIAANTKLAATATELAISLLSAEKCVIPLAEVVHHKKRSVQPSTICVNEVAHFSLPAFDESVIPEAVVPLSIKSSKFAIDQPSVLISKLNPRFPRVWNVASVPAMPALASTEFLVLDPIQVSTTVLWSMLSQPSFGASLESQVAGTSGSHQRVKPSDILSTLVPDPKHLSSSLQSCITSLGLQIEHRRREVQALASIRDTLLPQLMSGKLRVRDAEAILEVARV